MKIETIVTKRATLTDKKEFAATLNAGLTRTDCRVEFFPESEDYDDMIMLYEIDEAGQNLCEWGYEINLPAEDDGKYSLFYLGMPHSYEGYTSFAHTDDVTALIATINALKFHEDGTN